MWDQLESLNDDLRLQIQQLCAEYAAELQAGRRGNVKQYVEQMPPEGRGELLRELFAIRCEYVGVDQIDKIAEMWRMVFPDFRLKTPSGGSPQKPIAIPVAQRVAATEPSELPLDLLKRIDAVCLKFEDNLKAGREPDVTRLAREFPTGARSQLLAELLRIAVEYRQATPEQQEVSPVPMSTLEQTLIGVFGEPQPEGIGPVIQPAVVTPEQETRTYAGTPNLDTSTVIGMTSSKTPIPSAPTLSDYELLDELGRGGMGVVYKARQISLQRLVALKMVLRAEFASADDLVRFQQEAESAAQLDHPGIVPVYEVGESGGLPYFSMAFVEGPTLSKRLLEGPLGIQEAAELVRQLAVAVAYAHAKGIVHRDLKPGNVLLDNTGKPRITDFGLAKRLDSGQELTTTGQIVGTPSYMPPEQARGLVAEIDGQSDIYSLGAVLYACLTGRPPFQAANPIDTLQQVMRGEIARPSVLNRSIPRDLEIICLKCLSKRKRDRYATAAHLALDLNRWLKGEPIQARPVNRLRRAWMWCRRRPALAAAASVAVVASIGFLIAFGGFVAYQAQTAVTLKKADGDLKDREQRLRRTILEAQCDLDREFGRRQVETGEVINGVQHLLGAMTSAQRMGDAPRQQLAWGDLQAAMRRFVPLKNVMKDIIAVSPDARMGVQSGYHQQLQRYLTRLVDLSTGEPIGDELPRSTRALFAPDGRTIIVLHHIETASDPRQYVGERFETATGKSLGTVPAMLWPVYGDDQYRRAQREPNPLVDVVNGRRLMWSHEKQEAAITLQDIIHDREIAVLKHPGTVHSAEFSPDGKLIVTGCHYEGGRAYLWDAETGQPLGEPMPVGSSDLQFSPDGTSLLCGVDARIGAIHVWNLASRQKIGEFSGDSTNYDLKYVNDETTPWRKLLRPWSNSREGLTSSNGLLGFSPFYLLDQQGRFQRNNPAIYAYDFVQNRKTVWPVRHQQKITAVAISPDGSMLLTGSGEGVFPNKGDRTAILWDSQTGEPLRTPFRHSFEIVQVGFIPERPLAYVSGYNNQTSTASLQLWNLETGLPAAAPIPGAFKHVSPDGNTLVTGDNEVQVWDLTVFDAPTRLPVAPWMMTAHPDGSLFIVEHTGDANYPSGPLRKLSPTGRGFTLGGSAKKLRAGREDYGQISAMAVTPDGKELWLSVFATKSEGGNSVEIAEFHRLDPATLEPLVPPLPSLVGRATAMAFSSDGRRLAVGSAWTQKVHILDATTGTPEFLPLKGGRWSSNDFLALQFHPDGSRLDILDRGASNFDAKYIQPPQRYSWNFRDLEWTQRIVTAAKAAEGLAPGALSPTGKFFLSHTGRLYDPRTKEPIGSKAIDRGENFGGFAFADHDRVLLKLNIASIQGFDPSTSEPLGPPVMWEPDTQRSMLAALAVDTVRKRLVAVSIFGEGRLYDLTTGKQIGRGMGGTPGARKLDPRTDMNVAPPRFAAFSPNGQSVILPHVVQRNQYRFDVQARIWNIERQTAGPILTHPDPPERAGHWDFELGIGAAAFSPDSQIVATAANDGTIRFWDVATGKPSGPTIKQGEAANGRLIHYQDWGDKFLVQSFARNSQIIFTADGKQLLSWRGESRKLQLWDVATGAAVGNPVQIAAESMAPTVIADDGTILLNDATVVPFHSDHNGNVPTSTLAELVPLPQGDPLCAALSPDGSLSVVGYKDGLCWTLDAVSGRPLGQPMQHSGPVAAVAWSRDGRTIWTTSADRTLRSFQAPTVVPTDPERATVWIHIHTGYHYSLPKPPEGEVPLEQLTLQRGRQHGSSPSGFVSEDWWRQQRDRLKNSLP